MINLLKLAHDINTKLNKTKKYSSMTKDIVLSSIVYYSIRGLLDNRESTILKRLCDIISLENPTEKSLEKLVSPIFIDEQDGIKGIHSKITNLIIKIP